MRRLLAAATAAVLALAMVAPTASAQDGSWVNDIHVTQATVNQRTGEVFITGYAYCQNLGEMWLDVQGQVRQAIGRKTTFSGGMWGGIPCVPNGPAYFELHSMADWGMFGTGWGSVAFSFGVNNCDANGCWWQDFGGYGWEVIKIVKK